jgi:CubicO group peptidase (beta-lactamase class C family)
LSVSKTITPPLPRSTPEDEGISSCAILVFIEALERHTHPLDAVQSFMLLRHGTVVAEGWWAPYRPDVPHMLYSLSKSFTSSAFGIAVEEGLLSIDDPVLKFFPDDAPADPSEHLRAMTVRHLLTMNTGHHEDTVSRVWGGSGDNWPRVFLSLPVEHEPGSWFVYNTPATYMLSVIITQLTGEFLIDYLRPRLFEPLGIENPTWDVDPQGRSVGGSGLHITTDGIARFGQLSLQKGEWNGQRLLTEAWIDDATAAHSDNSITQTNPDWTAGYGYQFWRNRTEGYRGDGAFGQYCIVLPEHDVVLAMTSGVRDMQRVLDAVWEHLLPAFSADALPDDPAARTALEQTLAALTLPVAVGAPTAKIASPIYGTTDLITPN